MRFTLEIECDSAAFHDEDTEYPKEQAKHEIARILRVVTSQVEADVLRGTLRDFNGNTVGKFEIAEES